MARLLMSVRPVAEQDPIRLLDPLGAVPRPDGRPSRSARPRRGIARNFLGMCRPSSAPRMAEEHGGMLRGGRARRPGWGGGHEGDDQRGPQFRDCARMVHKMANILDKLPKGSQPKAKAVLHDDLPGRGPKAEAEKAFDLFVKTYEAKYPKATECLAKDREVLLSVLRLPGGALGAHPDDQPDRERVLDGAAEARQDEGEREPGGVPDDGVQADGVGIKGLAIVERFAAAGRGRPRDHVHRWDQGEARRLRIPINDI